jgi:CysZ protein
MVAFRRIGPSEAIALRKKNAFQVFLVGIFVAFLLTVPIVNLLTPVITTGMMVHLFEDFKSRA